ncbi:HAD-IA family hydrolase [bacterium]|nr:HAD-IA family hydrolase [bacterium]
MQAQLRGLPTLIRALIFDLDGVLVDAADWHYQALNRALSLFGHTIDPHEHAQRYNGLPTSLKLQTLSRESGFPVALHTFTNEMKQRYTHEIFAHECSPRPELTAALLYFRSQGYRLGVASNSSRVTLDLALKGLGITDCFDAILSHEDVGKPKPDPTVYEECFRRLGVSPQETLILEDSEPGIRAARDSRAAVMLVKHPSEVTLENILRRIEQTNQDQQRESHRPTVEILIPMAGRGLRFLEAGFARPKPFISVLGKPMIEWVVDNVRSSEYPQVFTFLVNEDHLKNPAYEALLNRVAPGCRIVRVPSTTQGAACTALLAADVLCLDRPLLIVNSDQWVEHSIDGFLQDAISSRCDGSILTFEATEDKWSFARLGADGWVEEVAEKRPISRQATVGIYYFREGRLFTDGAQSMIRKNIRTREEFYLCPVYNEMIGSGGKVRTLDLPPGAMHGLGTPEDLEAFLKFRLSEETLGTRPAPKSAPALKPASGTLPTSAPQRDPN